MPTFIRSDFDIESLDPDALLLHVTGELSYVEEWVDGGRMDSTLWQYMPLALLATGQQLRERRSTLQDTLDSSVIREPEQLYGLDPDTLLLHYSDVAIAGDWVRGERIAREAYECLPAVVLVPGPEIRELCTALAVQR